MAENVDIFIRVNGIDYTVQQLEEMGKAGMKAGEDIKKGTKEAAEEQGYFSKKLDEVKNQFKGLMTSAKELFKGFGKLSSGIASMAQSFGMSGKAAQVFGKVTAGAVAATGIGALLIAVLALVDYFKNLEGGAKMLAKVMNVLKASIGAIGDVVGALLKGDFKGAFNAMAGAVKEAATATDQLFAAQKKLNDQQIKNATATAASVQIIEKQKKILEDGTKSTEERLAALEKVTAETKKLAENQKAELQSALAVAQAELKLTQNYEERRQKMLEIAQLQGEIISKQTEITNIEYDAEKVGREVRAQAAADRKAKEEERRKNAEDTENTLAGLRVEALKDEGQKLAQSLALQKEAGLKELKSKTTDKTKIAEAEALYDAIALQQLSDFNAAKAKENSDASQAEMDRIKAENEAIRALEDGLFVDLLTDETEKALKLLEIERDRRKADLEEHGIYLDNKQALDQWYANEEGKIRKAQADKAIADENAKLAATAAAAGELADILGKETAAGQLAAVAQATINTYLGASQVVADETLPSFLKPIMVAAIIASGLKQVAAINNVQQPAAPKFADGGYVNGRSHAMGGVNIEAEGGEYIINKAAMSIPSVAAMAQQLNNMQSPSSVATGGGGEPLRAYVIATEVTSAQEANSKIQKIARL